MVRGTIVEVAAGKEITIQTLTGAIRTIPVGEAKYWGPVANMPGQGATNAVPQRPVDPNVKTVKVHLESMQKDLTYFVLGAVPGYPESDGFTRLCTVPCDVSLPVGSYHLAVTSGETSKPARMKSPGWRSAVDGIIRLRRKDKQIYKLILPLEMGRSMLPS
jgi:hypothetical protein